MRLRRIAAAAACRARHGRPARRRHPAAGRHTAPATAILSDADVGDSERYVNTLQTTPQPGGLKLASFGPLAEGFVAIVFSIGLVSLLARALARP